MAAASELELPREQWASHPRYATQALLVGSHRNFRLTSQRLIELADRDEDLALMQRRFRFWKAAMHSHERYEEHKLYPFLEARFDGLRCDRLRDGHERLAATEVEVRNAETAPELAAALRAHDEVLNVHLDEEEAVVVPALLALSPDEFLTYYVSDIDTLLSKR